MLDHALEYLKRGWCVIPCEPRGKQPLIKWAKYRDTRPTEEQIRDWWGRWPEANIALICGRVSGVVVVDVDPGRGGDIRGLDPTNLIAETGGGGFHLFYRYPFDRENVPNLVGKDGIDVRADGGYVIVAPSIHRTGNPYKWQYEGDPGPCPAWVLERPKSKDSTPKRDKWVTDLIQGGTSVGSRNDDVARFAGYLASKDIPTDIAEAMAIGWMKNQNDPLPDEEVSVAVQSVYRTASRQGKINGHDKNGKTFSSMNFGEYCMKYGGVGVRWLVDDWVPEDTIIFVTSPPGGFKTWMTFDLAVSVASGRPFLGKFPVNQTGPVIIIQQEDAHQQIVERFTTIALSKLEVKPPNTKDSDEFDVPIPPDLPIVIHPDRLLRFDDEVVMGELEKLVAKLRPKLVIIDPLYSAASTENYMAGSAEKMFALKRMRDQYGTSFVIVHHSKKSSEDWNRQNLWGSQFLNAFMETGWQIKELTNESATIVQRNFKAAKNPERVRIDFDIDTGSNYRFRTSVRDATEEEAKKAAAGQASDALKVYRDMLIQEKRVTPAKLAKLLDKSRSAVSRAMGKLRDAGEAALKDGEWVYLEHPDF